MLTGLQYRILKRISPGEPHRYCTGSAYAGKSKLETLLGREFLEQVPGKTVLDFGCGEGWEAIDLARRGAAMVIGLDNREEILQSARRNAIQAGVESVCRFVT